MQVIEEEMYIIVSPVAQLRSNSSLHAAAVNGPHMVLINAFQVSGHRFRRCHRKSGINQNSLHYTT